jgi:hypothetical protein
MPNPTANQPDQPSGNPTQPDPMCSILGQRKKRRKKEKNRKKKEN